MKRIILWLLLFPMLASAQQISGRVEVALTNADALQSYQVQGTGILRAEQSGIELQQSFVHVQYDLSTSWKADVVANAYSDGNKKLGFTQAFLHYKPLSPNPVKFSSRLGFFYPALSVENISDGWLSPYTYTQSAINSWFGEELRILGAEFSASSNGRSRRSPWSWQLHGSVFKSNDPIGSLITWRGFALHDRQSLHNDRISIAAIPSIVDRDTIWGPDYVKPFMEVDGKWGFYVGGHVRYFRDTEFRYYYFDNKAEPRSVNEERIYAWRTKFHSLAFQHQINAQWRFMSQFLDGATDMGIRIVYADYTAGYVALSYSEGDNRITFRYDQWDVREEDNKPEDQNNSHGFGVTTAWRHQLDQQWEVGLEYHINKNRAANRVQLNLPEQATQQQLKLVLSYQF
ncbi:hypothetical protein [Alteromonas facilis]|uniref:hypothetical protein n=1 Tax=Alteromonas facilis TaxID=2048004 RepID=UPI000C293C1E|nr:hypothetical protein [Alteromonas facilis]